MKKQVVTVLLALLPLASACPVKPGYIANGVVEDIPKMTPLCEVNTTVKALVDGARWVEVWGTSSDKKGVQNVAYVIAALHQKGWRLTAEQPTQEGKVYRFEKGTQIIAMLLTISDPDVFITLAGK